MSGIRILYSVYTCNHKKRPRGGLPLQVLDWAGSLQRYNKMPPFGNDKQV